MGIRTDERAARMVRLLEYINEANRAVPISELQSLTASEFGVSEVTLRSDLSALCALRGVRKLARGTYAPDAPDAVNSSQSLFSTRLLRRSESKIVIAREAVRRLVAQPDLRVLLLDAGTTTYYVADQLSERAGLDVTVWTPSVAAAYRLSGARGVSVRLLGGELQPEYAAVSGDETARALRALAGVDAELAGLDQPLPSFAGTHCVLDVNSITSEGKLFTDESKERLQKRLMAELSEDLTVVADHSKLFQPQLGFRAHEVYALERFKAKRRITVITDSEASGAQREMLQQVLFQAYPGARMGIEESQQAFVCVADLSGIARERE